MSEERKQRIAIALAEEIGRQRVTSPRLDIISLAAAVDAALDASSAFDEGRTPEELNASNDD